VQVMLPGFGPVFPGMGGGIGADEIALPVGEGARAVVGLQRRSVIRLFVAEHGTEVVLAAGGADQTFPVEVPGRVPKVTEQRAVGLPHLEPPPHPFVIVGLGHVQRDHAVEMPRHDLLSWQVGQELEDRSVALAVGRIDRHQSEPSQRVEELRLANSMRYQRS
jgi:hypothetical protein